MPEKHYRVPEKMLENVKKELEVARLGLTARPGLSMENDDTAHVIGFFCRSIASS